MLLQVVALLALGVLSSSAPTPTTEPSQQQQRSRVEGIIREVLEDMKKVNLHEVPTVVTVNAMMERCMQSYLETFAESLAAHKPGKTIAEKLRLVNSYENIVPKDLDKECMTVQVSTKVFLETLNKFLKLLFEKI